MEKKANWLSKFKELNEKYPDGGYVEKFSFSPDFKNCIVDFMVCEWESDCFETYEMTFKSCVRFELISVAYHANPDWSHKKLYMFSWGVMPDKTALGGFERTDEPRPYGVLSDYPELGKSLYPFFFEGHDARIEIFASEVTMRVRGHN